MYDPLTRVFTPLTLSDGLASNDIQALRDDGDLLRITYGQKGCIWKEYQQFPAGTYSPITGAFSPPGEPKTVEPRYGESYSDYPPLDQQAPFLGGWVMQEKHIDGKTWICSSHGLIILDNNAPRTLNISELAVTRVSRSLPIEPAMRQIAGALQRDVHIQSPDDLARALQDGNPYYRAQALAQLENAHLAGNGEPNSTGEHAASGIDIDKGYLPLIISQLNDPCLNVRATALLLLTKSNNSALTIPLFEKHCADREIKLRLLARFVLLERGILPERRYIPALLAGTDCEVPFGAGSRQKIHRL